MNVKAGTKLFDNNVPFGGIRVWSKVAVVLIVL